MEQLLEIYTANVEEFFVGAILHETEDYYIINVIDPEGRNDGFCCMKKELIYNIQQNTQYINRLCKFMDYQDSEFRDIEGTEIETMNDVYDLLQKDQRYVDFYIEKDQEIITGIILQNLEESIIVVSISEYGEMEVKETLDKNEIKVVHYDGIEHKLMEFLTSQNYRE